MRFSRHFPHASTVFFRIDLGNPLPARLEGAGSWIFGRFETGSLLLLMVRSRHGKASDFRVKELDMAPSLTEATCVRGPHGQTPQLKPNEIDSLSSGVPNGCLQASMVSAGISAAQSGMALRRRSPILRTSLCRVSANSSASAGGQNKHAFASSRCCWPFGCLDI